MKKFRFRLETLLDYRKNIEERERQALSRLNFRLHTEQAQRNEFLRQERDTRNELAQAQRGASEERDLQWYFPYLNRLKLEIDKSNKRIAQLDKEITAQKTAVIEATKKTKVLDALKAKKEKEFTTSIEKMEQKAVDEIVVTRFAHKES